MRTCTVLLLATWAGAFAMGATEPARRSRFPPTSVGSSTACSPRMTSPTRRGARWPSTGTARSRMRALRPGQSRAPRADHATDGLRHRSTSKQFTAFSILLLEREGKLSLDDDVRKYVPELKALEPTVTLRHLMLHTSGLRDYLTLWRLAGMKTENWTTQEDAVRLVARQRRATSRPDRSGCTPIPATCCSPRW